MNNRISYAVHRAFSAPNDKKRGSWGVAPGWNEDAPLALNPDKGLCRSAQGSSRTRTLGLRDGIQLGFLLLLLTAISLRQTLAEGIDAVGATSDFIRFTGVAP